MSGENDRLNTPATSSGVSRPDTEDESVIKSETHEPASNSPSVEQVLNTLDFEINRLTAEQQRPGWTVWALCGAILGAVWLTTEQWETGEADVIGVMYVFLFLSLAYDLLSQARVFFPKLHYWASSTYRVIPLFELVTPAQLLISATDAGVLIFIALALTDSLGLFLTACVIFIYTRIFISSIFIFVYSHFRPLVYLPFDSSTYRWVKITRYASLVVISVLMLWACIWLFKLTVALYPETVSLTDMRIGGLLVVITVLIQILAGHRISNPLLNTLADIRKQLAFGNIPLELAISRADIAISGMKVDTLLRSNLDDWLKYLEKLWALSQKLEDTFVAVSEELPEKDEDITNEHRALVIKRLQPLMPEIQHMFAHKDYMVKAIRRIESRAESYGQVSEEAAKIAEEVIGKINNSRIESFKRAERSFGVLSGILKRLYTDKPEEYKKVEVLLQGKLEEARKKVRSLEGFR